MVLVEVLERDTVILELKDGRYEPMGAEDMMEVSFDVLMMLFDRRYETYIRDYREIVKNL